MEQNSIQPIFIMGLPRTGSTLWSNIIASAPNVMRFGEMHFLHPWRYDFICLLNEKIGDLQKDTNVKRLGKVLFLNPGAERLTGNFWEQIKIVQPELLCKAFIEAVLLSDRSLGALFRIIVDESTRVRGYGRCLIKFPVFPAYIGKLMSWYPKSKIVHITRDPRATIVSKMNDPGGTAKLKRRFPKLNGLISHATTISVILQYIISSHAHGRCKSARNYRLFHFESLMSEPKPTILDLCDFLKLPYSDEMLFPRKSQPSSITGHRTSGVDPAAADRWRGLLHGNRERMVRVVTRQSMERLEYHSDGHSFSKR